MNRRQRRWRCLWSSRFRSCWARQDTVSLQ